MINGIVLVDDDRVYDFTAKIWHLIDHQGAVKVLTRSHQEVTIIEYSSTWRLFKGLIDGIETMWHASGRHTELRRHDLMLVDIDP